MSHLIRSFVWTAGLAKVLGRKWSALGSSRLLRLLESSSVNRLGDEMVLIGLDNGEDCAICDRENAKATYSESRILHSLEYSYKP